LRKPQCSFSWWRTQNAPIRAGFVLPFKEAQCFAPGWIYAGEMFDFSYESGPTIGSGYGDLKDSSVSWLGAMRA